MGVAVEQDVAPVLVLGLGNLLLKDDGVGLELLRRLQARRSADHEVREVKGEIEYVDGGTQGVALLGQLSGRRALLVLDAVSLGAEPGSVMVVRDPLEHVAPQGVGGHGANASGLLASAMLLGDLPPYAVVVGVCPAELATGIGLSARVHEALPDALAAADGVLTELCRRVRDKASEVPGVAPCTS